MPNNKILTAFFLAITVIVYCVLATLVQPTGAQRIEREYGVSVARFR